MPISRRTFLTLSGVSLLTAAWPPDLALAAPALPDGLAGRALRTVPVRRWPSADAEVLFRLWPDSVTPLRGRAGRWYAVPGGFVHESDLQPMLPYDPALAVPPADLPAWVTVIAPVAVVRAWASAAAPPVARIGWGGVLCAVDRLGDRAADEWVAVSTAPERAPLGWTPAHRWSAVLDVEPADGVDRVLRLSVDRAELSVWEGRREVLRAPAAVPTQARCGAWRITDRAPTLPGGESGCCGAAWALTGEGGAIYGVHWHNDFGAVGCGSGWEVSPLVARWLYTWLPEGGPVEVV